MSASSSVTNKSPPIRKIFVGNLNGKVSNDIIYFLLSSEVTVWNAVYEQRDLKPSFTDIGHGTRN
jgi:hypothetical protein